jgi:hypothetical protein
MSGCHTIEGAGAGAAWSIAALGQNCGSSGDGGLVILIGGAIVGAAIGVVRDIGSLLEAMGSWADDGITWDSPEGRRLRRGSEAQNE